MSTLLKLSGATLVLALAALASAEDRLFVDQDDSPGKVFDAASGSPATTAQRIESIDKLKTMLDEMGLPAASADDKEITLRLNLTKWSFPCHLRLSENGETVAISLALPSQPAGKLDSGRLLALLNANSQVRPAVFAYSDQRQRMELQLGVPNQNVNPSLLEGALKLLVRTAANTSSIWDAPATAKTEPAAKPEDPASSAAPSAAGIVGNWSATRGPNEAFAIALKSDGTFELVYVKNKETSKSTGKYVLKEGKLTLSTSAGSQEADITNVTGSSFEFQSSAGAEKLTFKKAT